MSELTALLVGGTLTWWLYQQDEPTLASVTGVLTALAVLSGFVFTWRTGDLALAWRCPRLDRLGVRLKSRAAPWDVLGHAEAALQTLASEATPLDRFAPSARLDIARSARRAVEVHVVKSRAEGALRHAPEGAARQALLGQSAVATQELSSLNRLLAELRARFVASTAPLSSEDDAAPALLALNDTSVALGDAREEEDRPAASRAERVR